jgi:putative FmdB family regulatory protein
MPLYEYRCEEDGETITLLRPMADADRPVEDPKGLGRTFVRTHSTFAVGAGKAAAPSAGCACGNPNGPCSM